jgi:hypothetical protein
MDWPITLALTAVVVVATGLCGWMGARAPNPHRGPRLVPWRFLMILGVLGVILMVVHMLNLAGMHTGRSGGG